MSVSVCGSEERLEGAGQDHAHLHGAFLPVWEGKNCVTALPNYITGMLACSDPNILCPCCRPTAYTTYPSYVYCNYMHFSLKSFPGKLP